MQSADQRCDPKHASLTEGPAVCHDVRLLCSHYSRQQLP